MAVSKVGPFARDAAIAAVDLSNSLYLFVTKNPAGQLVLPTAQGDVVGVVYETNAINRPVTFAMADTGAIVKVVAGAALAVGAKVAAAADGRAIAATGNGVGVVRTAAAAANDIVEIYFRPVAV